MADAPSWDKIIARRNAQIPDPPPRVSPFEIGAALFLLGYFKRRREATVSAPVNTVLPAITGTATVGQTLSVDDGTWTGDPTSYAYVWKADGVAIEGATASTYQLTEAEEGKVVSCTVTATNAGGSTAATSEGTVEVEASGFTLTDSRTATGVNPSWSNVDIGAAHTDREIVITLSCGGAGSMGAVDLDIGGITMTRYGSASQSVGIDSRNCVRLFKAKVPTGTTATVAVSNGSNSGSAGWSMKVYRGIGPFYPDHFTFQTGVDVSQSLGVVGGGFSFAVNMNNSQAQDTSLSGIGGTANNINVSTILRASHGYEAFSDGIQTVTAPSIDAALVRTFRRDQAPLNIALVTQDTSHDAATNTKAALEASGHTVTLIADSAIGSTDFSAYDVIVACRNTGTSTTSASSTVAGQLRALVNGGKPLVVGSFATILTAGTGRSTIATLMNLTGTWRIINSTDGGEDMVVTSTAHPVTDGFSLATVQIYSAANFQGSLTSGQSYVGTALATGDPGETTAGEVALIAIPSGTTDLAAGTVGARVVVGDWPYAGQSAMTERGKTLLNRAVQWAAGNI